MTRSASSVLLVLLASANIAAAGEPVPASRRTDWTYAGVRGGVPNRTTICATFSPGATASAINNAIAACNSGVVKLNAGTYTAASLGGQIQLNKSNVTLRGSGADKTILTGGGIIALGSGSNSSLGTAITGGTQGATTITVASTSGLAAGAMIEIDRDDDLSLVGGPAFGRNVTQVNSITAISGNKVTLRNPLFHDFSRGNPKVKFVFPTKTQLSGVEDMKLDHNGFSGGYNFMIEYCDSCWIKGVDSANATGYHFIILGTLNLELRNNFVHDGGEGPNNSGFNFYGNYLYGANSNARIENNVFNKDFPAIELNNSSSGFFIGYNYSHGTSFGGVSWTYDDGHAPFNVMNLYEGNIGEMWGMDGYFGGSGAGTLVRNHFTGYNPNGGAVGDAIQIKRLGYQYNLVGNVLGSANQKPKSYQSGCGSPNIYQLGYPNIGNCDTSAYDGYQVPGGYPDAKVRSTLLRWGNYDYFNKAARFVASELPAGVAAPTDQTVRQSYVYTAKPAWWPTGVAWPPIGPDVTGGTGDASGHVHKTPAQLCWDRIAGGVAFNASTCFGAGSGGGGGGGGGGGSGATIYTLFSAGAATASVTANDTSPVELGVKFTSSQNGYITAVRFYKGPRNVGTHTAHLWSSGGALLASATYSGETASGWQTVRFASPVPVTAGTTYVASYHSNGYYSINSNFFTTAVRNGPLTALATSNGVYTYGGVSFPRSSHSASNYWVDVVFR